MACVTIAATRLRGLPTGILAWWQCALGTVTLWVWPVRYGWPAWGASWAWLAGLGIVHTGLAYTLMYSGMARLKTDRISLLQFVYPAVAIIIDRLFLGQRLSGLQLAGIAMMSAAIWFAERERRSKKSGFGTTRSRTN
jgi:drug/metabolite transporter (DMT)-like permease